ncbi:MAG: DNA repair protein RecN [Gammaproteobacteria bacterium]|nr:DNA repair protein RecN [Gammaproteobacteria bacterium]
MLTHIAVRDFAIIDTLELDLTSGMSVLTGETGAGKSILVDALGLVLGDRADAGVVRHGTERAEITAEFDIRSLRSAQQWLESNELTADNECILRRIIGHDGRSRGLINGRSVPMQLLKELGEQLVDIHGQHEHQSLLRPASQLALLDGFGNHGSLLEETASLYSKWKSTNERLAALQAAASHREQQLELLRHQAGELEALGLSPGEISSLDEEHRRLANGGRLMQGAQAALDGLYENEENSAYRIFHQALNNLETLRALDPRLQEITATLNSAEIQLSDACEALRRYLHASETDPERLNWVENRLGAIHDVARKHHVEPQHLPELLARLRMELENLENAGVALQELETQLHSLRDAYRRHSQRLSNQRRQAAAELGKKVSLAMRELGMPGGRFAIEIHSEAERFSTCGIDQAEFQVSANQGQPLKTMAKVASGGELSRIALAIQVVAAQASMIPTMIFDEVDAGIGGGVAEIVGRRLRSLGNKRQVLCVTHLPQVASQAHQHYRVVKSSHGQNVQTALESLDKKSRIEELARMLGGVEITETTRKHAQEMIARAAQEA